MQDNPLKEHRYHIKGRLGDNKIINKILICRRNLQIIILMLSLKI